MDEPLKILSLGAGVQSTTLFLMSGLGQLPKIDHAIFADTGWEPKKVYEHLEWLKIKAEEFDIPLHVVSNGDIKDTFTDMRVSKNNGKNYWRGVVPTWTVNQDGTAGRLPHRRCTVDFKITPVERKIKHLAGIFRKKAPEEIVVEQWFGISTDETQRCRVSQDKWLDFRYPLIVDKPMSRTNCYEWLNRHYPDYEVPRSSCIGCPFHSDFEWMQLTKDEFADAVLAEQLMRESLNKCEVINAKDMFLHQQRIPLDQVVFKEGHVDPNQTDWVNECIGMCGV